MSACTNSTACYTSVTMRFDLILATGGSRSLGHVPLLHSSLPNHTAVDLFLQQVKSEFWFRIIALFFVVCRYNYLSTEWVLCVHMIYLYLTPSQLLIVLIIRSIRPISKSSYLSKKSCKIFIKKHHLLSGVMSPTFYISVYMGSLLSTHVFLIW